MRVLKVLPIRKAKSKFSRRRTILMLQLSDFRKSKKELKRLLELHKVRMADEGGSNKKEEESKEVTKVLPPALDEDSDSSDVEVVYAMKSGNVTLPNTYYVT